MKQAIIFIITVFLFSCVEPVDKPDDLIDREDMEEILTEIYLYENLNVSPPLNVNQKLENQAAILEKHKVSVKAFENSFTYYSLQTDLYKEMIENVQENLVNKLDEDLQEELVLPEKKDKK